MKKNPVNPRRKFKPWKAVTVSAPCRVDLGGTLDLSTFYYPLMDLGPCTFNMALNLRTRVRVSPFDQGMIRVSSKGFESACFASMKAPYDHPMGLMFAIADYFKAEGVAIDIDSASPPRSALGGSSVAAVALIEALARIYGPGPLFPGSGRDVALLANRMETLTAQTPCGIQDHLAAVYGGVNLWTWHPGFKGKEFSRKVLIQKKDYPALEKSMLLAYCGNPHESLNVNGRWVRQFLSGEFRREWVEIIDCTRGFAGALEKKDLAAACRFMNLETDIRMGLTPDVLDAVGQKLVSAARMRNGGARFAGAGGGGCVWALGEGNAIQCLRPEWEDILSGHENARMLEASLDHRGLRVHEIT
jgi:D-glycero-alpha-D-manno-heptose-7-phosphate kinase